MADSNFQIEKVGVPVTPDKGGTGLTTLTDKGVLIGAGTGSVTTIAPGASGNLLKSDGTNWTSATGGTTLGDGTVSYEKLATDLTQIVAVSASDIDWSAGAIYTKTLSGNTTLTFSNYKLDKMIVLEITGNYTLALPATVNLISGTYNGTAMNYITLHCTKATATEQVWAMISQNIQSNFGYGYFAGGNSGGWSAATDRIIFSTGATSTNTASNLSQARGASVGLSDGSTYGYFAGGDTGNVVTTADRIVFSTGITSLNTVSNLSQIKGYSASSSDGSTYGYFAGGITFGVVATTDRIVFSTGTTSANTVSNLSQARYALAGLSDGSTYGYFAGGTTNAIVGIATTDRIVFSTGTTSANTVSNLSQARYALAGLSDGSIYGYFAGGDTGAVVATTDRLVFSTGTTSANTVSNLSQARYYLAGSSDGSTYGYFAGGYSNTIVTTADRIVFSTGATLANTVSNLSQARFYLAGLSDSSV